MPGLLTHRNCEVINVSCFEPPTQQDMLIQRMKVQINNISNKKSGMTIALVEIKK